MKVRPIRERIIRTDWLALAFNRDTLGVGGGQKRVVDLACDHKTLTAASETTVCPRCTEMLRRSVEDGSVDYEAFRRGAVRDDMAWQGQGVEGDRSAGLGDRHRAGSLRERMEHCGGTRMTTLRETYGYDPYTLKRDTDRMMAVLRVVRITDNPTVLDAWRVLETLVGVACADQLKEAQKDSMLHEVHIIESERGWGQKVDEYLHFLSRPDAEKFVRDFNSKNTSDDPVPDIYWRAEIA